MPPDVEAADIAEPWKHTARDDERNGESIKFFSAAVSCAEVTDDELLIMCHRDTALREGGNSSSNSSDKLDTGPPSTPMTTQSAIR